MPRVIEIPVTRRDTPRRFHFGEERCARVRCENMEGCRGDAIVDCPIYCVPKYVRVVIIESEHETSVNHDAEVVESSNRRAIILPEVLALVALSKIRRTQGLKSDEETPQPRL